MVRQESLSAFIAAYKQLGFRPCPTAAYEPEFEKIALYMKDGSPRHAAKQLPNGLWSSKLGSSVDIQHTLDALNGGPYGEHAVYMKRRPKV